MQIYYATVHYDEKWAPEQDSIDEPRAEEQREHGGHLRKEKLQKQKNKTARPKTPKKNTPTCIGLRSTDFFARFVHQNLRAWSLTFMRNYIPHATDRN